MVPLGMGAIGATARGAVTTGAEETTVVDNGTVEMDVKEGPVRGAGARPGDENKAFSVTPVCCCKGDVVVVEVIVIFSPLYQLKEGAELKNSPS